MAFSRAELLEFTGATIPDLVAHPTRLLIVGINPGLLTVAVQAHFAPRGNRFYRALYRGGVTDRLIDASRGFEPGDHEHLVSRGIGITSIVPGATARAADLSAEQLREGAAALRERVAAARPAVVAFLGITAYRIAFDEPRARVGRQPHPWGVSEVWVVPNPSGLNFHASVDDLARAYREVAVAAGITPYGGSATVSVAPARMGSHSVSQPPGGPMRFASIRIITNDVDRLVDFYERVTGIAPVRPAPFFAQFDTAGGAIAIADPQTVAMLGPSAPQPGSNASVIVEFLVDDVDAEFERLRADLTDVVLEPTTMPWGNRSVIFRDPDGNLVNLFTRPPAPTDS